MNYRSIPDSLSNLITLDRTQPLGVSVSLSVGLGGKLFGLRLTLNRRLMSHRSIPDSLSNLITLDRTQTL